MSLPDDYLTYPKRRHGQDIDRHDWRLAKDGAHLAWPGGKDLAVMIVVPAEFHPLNPSNKPFRHPAGMVTPYPDLRHFTTRDYGNRVGIFRILDALKAAGLKATVPMSAMLLKRAQPLVDAVLEDGHEIAAAGLHADAIHWGGMDSGEEERRIAEVRAAFAVAGLDPKVWMSPARSQSFATPDLLAAAGFTAVLDWETDQVPVQMRTSAGPLVALPVHNELEDFKLLNERSQSEEVWRDQILEARDFLLTETGRYGAQMLGFTLTPFIAGQPFRIPALREMFAGLASDPRVWSATASEIVTAFEAAS